MAKMISMPRSAYKAKPVVGKTQKLWVRYLLPHDDDRRAPGVKHCADCGVVRARLRDVAAAALWCNGATDAEFEFENRVREGWDGEMIEASLYYAIFYRGLLSLCEAE
jgi:hypothetical protein